MSSKSWLILVVFYFFGCLFGWSQRSVYFFSGSDWCSSCIKFKKEVVDSELFKGFVKESKITFEILDFPQRKKGLSKRYQNYCDSMASIYNREASFPKLISNIDGVVRVYNCKLELQNLVKELKKSLPIVTASYSQIKKKMDSPFILKITGNIKDTASIFQKSWAFIDSVENSISSWDSLSITNSLVKYAGIEPIKVPLEYYNLIQYCIKMSEVTQGAFDVTIKPALQIWDWRKGKIPSDSLVNSIKCMVGYEKIKMNLEDTSIYLTEKGMKIDLGGIGKGYVADRLVEFWSEKLIIDYGSVNAGGDIVRTKNHKKTFFYIPDPKNTKKAKYEITFLGNSIVTSGDYFRKFERNSELFSHIIDPKTCRPTKSGISSITVISPNGIMGDALATAISVMGKNAGLDLINQLPNVEGIIIMSNGQEFRSKKVQGLNN
jgi:thiamine biosynthesis lipoprotein